MCVVSAVFEYYEPIIPKIQPIGVAYPEPEPTLKPVWWPQLDISELKSLLSEFKEAVAAAKTVDRLTGQPDCLDPDKAMLEARVRELEAQLEVMRLRERVRVLEEDNLRLRDCMGISSGAV